MTSGIYSSSSTILPLFLFCGTLNLPLFLQIYSIRSIIWFKYRFLFVIYFSSFPPLLPPLPSTPFQDRHNGRRPSPYNSFNFKISIILYQSPSGWYTPFISRRGQCPPLDFLKNTFLRKYLYVATLDPTDIWRNIDRPLMDLYSN